MKPLHSPLGEGQKVNVIGNALAILIHGRDTDGILSVVESVDLPRGGLPPHVHHREEETFQVIEGEYEFIVEGKTIKAEKGATVFAPRNVPHTYRCAAETSGRLTVVITPAGFEGFFEEIGALSPQEQQDIPRLMEMGVKYGVEARQPNRG